MRIVFLGGYGSDAGYSYIGADGKVHHVGGWGPEAVLEVSRAISILGEATQLKTPALSEAVIKSTLEFVTRNIGANLKEGDVVVMR
jgi:hypothetical protein